MLHDLATTFQTYNTEIKLYCIGINQNSHKELKPPTYTIFKWGGSMSPQMEFSWTSIWQKTRVFCSLLFTVDSTGGFLRKPYSTLVYLWIALYIMENWGQKARVSSLCPKTSTENGVQEFHLCTVIQLRATANSSCGFVAFILNHILFKTTFEPGRRSSQPKPSLWSPNGSECETLRVKNYS